MDFVPYPSQPVKRALATYLFADQLDQSDGAVKSDPCHYLGMREVLRRHAHLPYPLVGETPDPRQMPEQRATDRDCAVDRRHAVAMGVVQCVENLPEDVELRLVYRSIADADRPRALIARQPGRLPLGQSALTAKP